MGRLSGRPFCGRLGLPMQALGGVVFAAAVAVPSAVDSRDRSRSEPVRRPRPQSAGAASHDRLHLSVTSSAAKRMNLANCLRETEDGGHGFNQHFQCCVGVMAHGGRQRNEPLVERFSSPRLRFLRLEREDGHCRGLPGDFVSDAPRPSLARRRRRVWRPSNVKVAGTGGNHTPATLRRCFRWVGTVTVPNASESCAITGTPRQIPGANPFQRGCRDEAVCPLPNGGERCDALTLPQRGLRGPRNSAYFD